MTVAGTNTNNRGSRVAAALVHAIGAVASLVVLAVLVTLAVLVVDRVPLSAYNVTDADRLIGLVLGADARLGDTVSHAA